MLIRERKLGGTPATLGVGAAAIAVVCCAGLPAIGALLGGLSAGALLGFGLGVTPRRRRLGGPSPSSPASREATVT